jgi:predicted ATPase
MAEYVWHCAPASDRDSVYFPVMSSLWNHEHSVLYKVKCGKEQMGIKTMLAVADNDVEVSGPSCSKVVEVNTA